MSRFFYEVRTPKRLYRSTIYEGNPAEASHQIQKGHRDATGLVILNVEGDYIAFGPKLLAESVVTLRPVQEPLMVEEPDRPVEAQEEAADEG